jgi:asparagine synthase (glutamine-hydrolysing)
VTPAEAIHLVEESLRDSVRESLIADVPVGVYLSGGVDSSLLTAMARREHPAQVLHTFGASFGDERYDENSWARKVSRLAETIHHEVVVTPEDFLDNWGKLSWQRDGPLSEPADVAMFRLAQLAREHVKVVLSGEGSDELFAGYPKYVFAGATRWLGAVPSARLLGSVERSLPAGKARLRTAVRMLAQSRYEERLRGWFGPFTVAERQLLTGRPPQRKVPDPYRLGRGDSLRRMLYADTCVYLADNLLERGDRMSMAASLETRPPFLDYRLVELAFELPSRVKTHRLSTKWVLKEVARNYLPDAVVDRPKIGFRVPLDRWFRHGLKDMAFDLLTGPSSYVGNNFDSKAVSSLLGDHMSGRRDEELRIWTLLSLEVWYRDLASRAILTDAFAGAGPS